MNRFEQAVYDCMGPTAELVERTENPLHRAMLLNFWRHVHLEGAGEFEQIVADDMMVDHPVYRVTWGANPAVIDGKDGVLAFYRSVGDAVLWQSDDRLSVGGWVAGVWLGPARAGYRFPEGRCGREFWFPSPAGAPARRACGPRVRFRAPLSRGPVGRAFICPSRTPPRLAGEHLYEDKTSLE